MKTQRTDRKLRSAFSTVSLMLFVPLVAWSQTDEWTVYNAGNSGLPYNGVTALAIDAQENVWVGTGRWWAHAGGGLAKFDGVNWTVYSTSNSGLPDNDHVSLSIDAEGGVWSGTENGLSRFDGVNWAVYKTHNSGLQSNRTGAPIFDDEGNAWIATFPDGGLAKFDGENWTVYKTHNSGLPSNFITDVEIDVQGTLWAGTFGGGVVKFDGKDWTVYNTANSEVPHNDSSFLSSDDEGNVWLGTYGGGIAKFDGVTWTAYTRADSGLPHNWIWNLNVDPQGNVWAGTRAGLARFDGAHWTVYNTDNSGLPDNNVYCVAFDAQGNIWIGTQDGGLAVFHPEPVVDFDGDGIVDIDDLLRLVESWGQDDPMCDIGPTVFGDGTVNAADLEVLMSHWAQDVEDPTLIAHWALDEVESDVAWDSAGENDGVVGGRATWQPEDGVVDGALAFDGVDAYVMTPSVLNPADGPFSVLAWVKGDTPGQVVLSQSGGNDWLLTDSSGALMTDLKGSGRKAQALYSQAVITDGQWHRIGLTWDGLTRTLYVDGVTVAEDVPSLLPDISDGLHVGAGATLEPGTFFSGLIDDVRIYNRAVRP